MEVLRAGLRELGGRPRGAPAVAHATSGEGSPRVLRALLLLLLLRRRLWLMLLLLTAPSRGERWRGERGNGDTYYMRLRQKGLRNNRIIWVYQDWAHGGGKQGLDECVPQWPLGSIPGGVRHC